MPSANVNLWNFPGGISDWLDKGHSILDKITNFQNRQYNEATQIAFMQALRDANLTTGNPNAIQGRKILNSFAKVGFVATSPTIHLTQKGRDFLTAQTTTDKEISLRKTCESMEFWNPVETDMARDFNIKPYATVIYLLMRLGYLSNREIEKYVLRIKNQGQIDSTIQSIKNARRTQSYYSPTTDEKNRASWMMSLFGSTDLVRHWHGKIYLDSSKATQIVNTVKPFVPNAEILIEKEVDAEINTEIQRAPQPNMDGKLGELLNRRNNTIRNPIRVVRKTYLYKREVELANLIKKLYDFKCQICGTQLKKTGWTSGMVRNQEWGYLYAETAHIKDISNYPQYDVKENMLCLCPNCHKNLDNGVYRLSESRGIFTCIDVISGITYQIMTKAQHGLTLFS